MLSIKFWGVRGSTPCPGPDTIIYGGNTSCIEIRADDNIFIIDLGTGARLLGDELAADAKRKNKKIKAEIFITHTHWDHIMGFPMFTPVYTKDTELKITGPVISENESLKDIFETQLSHNFWPVRLNELSASIEYNQIKETTLFYPGGLEVSSKILNHPITCLGYRFNYQGKSIAVIFDHEPYSSHDENEKIINFIKDTDILIHDSHYTKEEYPAHIGWGHSTLDNALQNAAASRAKTLIFFHHEPSHSDSKLEQLEKEYSNREVKCIMAREGMLLNVV